MTRRATDNMKALDAFIAAKTEIDAMLERLAALSAERETRPFGDPFCVKRSVPEGRMALPTHSETKRKKAPIGPLDGFSF